MSEAPPVKLCPCGRPLHYFSKVKQAQVQALCNLLGEDIPVHFTDRVWMVSRHYIALHGLRPVDLPTLPYATEVCIDCRKPIAECGCRP